MTAFVQQLIDGEIRRYVAEAIKTGDTLSAPVHAAKILRTYPTCGLTVHELADLVMIAAAKAGVAVEIGEPAKRLSRA